MDKEHTSFFKEQNQRPKLNNLDLKNILNNNINDKSKHIKTSMTTKKFKGIYVLLGMIIKKKEKLVHAIFSK